jgi:hypothetical protein
MPCCGLDVMLDGGASMLSAAAAVMSNSFISAEDKIIIMSSNTLTTTTTPLLHCKVNKGSLLFLGGVAVVLGMEFSWRNLAPCAFACSLFEPGTSSLKKIGHLA